MGNRYKLPESDQKTLTQDATKKSLLVVEDGDANRLDSERELSLRARHALHGLRKQPGFRVRHDPAKAIPRAPRKDVSPRASGPPSAPAARVN